MLYEFLLDLKSKIEKSNERTVYIVSSEPMMVELNNIYIVNTNNYSINYYIGGEGKGSFTIDVLFVNSQCDVNAIDKLALNIDTSLKEVMKVLRNDIDLLASNYSDDDITCVCRRHEISSKQWFTGGTVLIGTRLRLLYETIYHT